MALSLQELLALRVAEYRFLENSLLDLSGNGNHLTQAPGDLDVNALYRNPAQGVWGGTPSLLFDSNVRRIINPIAAADWGAEASDWILEFVGVPRQNAEVGQAADATANEYILGIDNAETGVFLRAQTDDSRSIHVDLGTEQTTSGAFEQTWQPDSLLHLVVAQVAGEEQDPNECSVWCDGVLVLDAVDAGAGAVADGGAHALLFNGAPGQDLNQAFFGHALFMRMFSGSTSFDDDNARALFHRAQALLNEYRWPVPIRAEVD